MSIESEILLSSHVVAIVGLSKDMRKPSYQVANYLRNNGYKIIPVNPKEKIIMDKVCYPNLISIPEPVDVVDVFRKSEYVLPIVEEAINIRASAIWLQEGINNEEAIDKAKKAGLKVVIDKCMRKELIKLKEDEHKVDNQDIQIVV